MEIKHDVLGLYLLPSELNYQARHCCISLFSEVQSTGLLG